MVKTERKDGVTYVPIPFKGEFVEYLVKKYKINEKQKTVKVHKVRKGGSNLD